jgi:formate dehydrogenase major subunit
MECIVIQDIFHNETSRFAHVFLPGSSFLEKDGTFTNAERRISRVRKIIEPLAGLADWEATVGLSNALGYPMNYTHPSQIMDEIAALTPTFRGVSYEKLDELGSIQWPCNDQAPSGTPTMHVGAFVRGKGKFYVTSYVPTNERTSSRYPLLLTTGRVLTQYNVGAQTRRTANLAAQRIAWNCIRTMRARGAIMATGWASPARGRHSVRVEITDRWRRVVSPRCFPE